MGLERIVPFLGGRAVFFILAYFFCFFFVFLSFSSFSSFFCVQEQIDAICRKNGVFTPTPLHQPRSELLDLPGPLSVIALPCLCGTLDLLFPSKVTNHHRYAPVPAERGVLGRVQGLLGGLLGAVLRAAAMEKQRNGTAPSSPPSNPPSSPPFPGTLPSTPRGTFWGFGPSQSCSRRL